MQRLKLSIFGRIWWLIPIILTIAVYCYAQMGPGPLGGAVGGMPSEWHNARYITGYAGSREIYIHGTVYVHGPDVSGSNTYRLPITDGTASQVIQTDGAGTCTFATAGGEWTDAGTYLHPADGDEYVACSDTGTRDYASGDGDLYVEDDAEIDGDLNVDGTTLFVQASTNRVGIGTAGPNAELEVNGDIILGSAKQLYLDGSVVAPYIRIYGTTHFNLRTKASTGFFTFTQGSTEFMRIDNQGNIGIGTATPDARLHVGDDSVAAGSATGAEDLYVEGAAEINGILYADGGIIATGIHDFGGATSVEIPNSANPTLSAEGQIAWDTNDGVLMVHAPSVVSGGPMAIPLLQDKDFVIFQPDQVNDEMYIFYIDPDIYPHGIRIHSLSITLPSDAAYSIDFEEWAGDPPVFQNTTQGLATSASDSYRKIHFPDIGVTDVNLDASDYLFADIPSTNVDWIAGKIIFFIKEGN